VCGTPAAKVRRVVLVENDQFYRETPTGELLRQDLVVHAFAGGASCLPHLPLRWTPTFAVLDWDLANRFGINLLAELRRHGINPPVVFLTGEFITGENERCNLASPEALDIDEGMAFDQGCSTSFPSPVIGKSSVSFRPVFFGLSPRRQRRERRLHPRKPRNRSAPPRLAVLPGSVCAG
jgi:CheY-like chemotaxis protein